MVEHQGPRRRAVVKIIISGIQDVTDKLHPYLISVQVMDSIEGTHSECHIELDDRNAELQIPPDGVMLQVALGWAGSGPDLIDTGRRSISGDGQVIGQGPIPDDRRLERPFGGPGLELVFNGWVQEVESGFGRRGGGRRLWITGSSGDIKSLVKQVTKASMGDGKPDDSQQGQQQTPTSDATSAPTSDATGGKSAGATQSGGTQGQISLYQVATEIFGKAGVGVFMSPQMMKIKRDFWHINESAMNWGQRIMQEVGGFFKIENGVAKFVGKNEGVNMDGMETPDIEAVWGVNLIGWRIKPYAGRPQYGKAASSFFDLYKAVHDTVEKAIPFDTPFGGTDAIAHGMATVLDKNQGEQQNSGQASDVVDRRGTGWVLLNGEPTARGGGRVRIVGARPGVDGLYTITEAEHNYTRNVGYTTRCNVWYPLPDISGYGWKRLDAEGQRTTPPPPELQSRDPYAPGYVPPQAPLPPGPTKDELERQQDRTFGQGDPFAPIQNLPPGQQGQIPFQPADNFDDRFTFPR